ncbi:MAG: SurA N-terminal domain-containing protein, partial [Gammaproteobacteria bacterium]|nr:SurA N-terminal domain-containing protein [Gammaproteobacteria bacterium]
MLTQIREKFAGGIAIVILGAIAVSFIFFGTNVDFSGGNIYAAKVDGSEISVNELELDYRARLDANPQLANLPAEFRVQLRQNILDALIRERLVDLYLEDAGYQVSESFLDESIQRIPEFQLDGVFDLDTAESLLMQNGYTVQGFRAAQRRQLRLSQLQRAIGGTSLVTPAEYRRYLNLIAEQRLVSVAAFDLASAADEVTVTEEQVTTFYADNESLYLLPESATIEYIELNRSALAESVSISEEALNEYYLDSQSRYLQDEQRRASHILILFDDDEAAAEMSARALLARLEAGEPFADLAKTNSMDGGTAAQGGDLGSLTRSQLPGELGAEIFSMQLGEISGPVRSEFGFHIVRLDDILLPGPLPLDQVRGELLTELRERETEGAFRDLVRTASDALFDNPDMQAIAAAAGLEVQ